MEKHDKNLLAQRSPNDVKSLEMALHLNSGYHRMQESQNADYTYLKKKHDEAHEGKKSTIVTAKAR